MSIQSHLNTSLGKQVRNLHAITSFPSVYKPPCCLAQTLRLVQTLVKVSTALTNVSKCKTESNFQRHVTHALHQCGPCIYSWLYLQLLLTDLACITTVDRKTTKKIAFFYLNLSRADAVFSLDRHSAQSRVGLKRFVESPIINSSLQQNCMFRTENARYLLSKDVFVSLITFGLFLNDY